MDQYTTCNQFQHLKSNRSALKDYLNETHTNYTALFSHELSCSRCANLVDGLARDLYEKEESFRSQVEGDLAQPFLSGGKEKILPGWTKEQVEQMERETWEQLQDGQRPQSPEGSFFVQLSEALEMFNQNLQHLKIAPPLLAAQCQSAEEGKISGESPEAQLSCTLVSEEEEQILWVGCKEMSFEGMEFTLQIPDHRETFAFKLQKKRASEELVEDQQDLSPSEYNLIRENGLALGVL